MNRTKEFSRHAAINSEPASGGTSGRMTVDMQNWLMNQARELGDYEHTPNAMRQRFLKRFGIALTRQTALYWKEKAFARDHIRTPFNVHLSLEQCNKVDELIRSGYFEDRTKVIAAAVDMVYRFTKNADRELPEAAAAVASQGQ